MITGMRTHVTGHPQFGSFHAIIISEPSMDKVGNWFICVTKEGKIIPVDVCYCEAVQS